MKRCRDCVAMLLGTCHNMRPCKVEREMLTEQTLRRAHNHGHTLAEFVKLTDQAVFQSKCLRCGMLAGFNLNPSPRELDIYGDAVNTDCSQPDAGVDQLSGRQEDDA